MKLAIISAIVVVLLIGGLLGAMEIDAGEVASDQFDHTEGGRYPAHWWEPVAETDKAWWEILPQAAGPGEVILSKRNELGLLSNFAATRFEFKGKTYASLEGLWQSMKYPEASEGRDDPRTNRPEIVWPHSRQEVAEMVAFQANTAGQEADAIMKTLGIDWVSFEGERVHYKTTDQSRHYAIIEAATWAKVRQNPRVKEVLLSTGDLTLRPDHITEEDPPPAWRYYEIYMKIRAELTKQLATNGSPSNQTYCLYTSRRWPTRRSRTTTRWSSRRQTSLHSPTR